MASELARPQYSQDVTSLGGGHRLPRRVERELGSLSHRTLLRQARVQAEGFVQNVKLQEIDSLVREASVGHAMLIRYRDSLSADDPFLADELKFFTDMARMGKGEILADTIDSFCRESRS